MDDKERTDAQKNVELTFEYRDEYKRKPIAETVLTGCKNEAPMFPLMVTGDWGTGKSEFAEKLCNLTNESSEQVAAVYVDAYKSDYQDDPLISLSAAILEVLPEDQKEEVKKKLIPVLKALGKTGLKGLVSYVMKKDADIVAEEFEKDLKKTADTFIDSILTEKAKANSYLEALREVLEQATVDKKILICIDELDRCKPTFAVNMIEMVKHVFDANNVCFVLIVNRVQLEAALKSHYGNYVDTKRYLDKFVRFSITLPAFTSSVRHNEQKTVTLEHFEKLIGESGVLRPFFELRGGRCFFKDILAAFITRNNLSFREAETLVRYLTIYHSISENGYAFHQKSGLINAFKGVAIFLVAFNPEIANDVIRTRSAIPFLNWLEFDHSITYENNRYDGLKLVGMFLHLESFSWEERENMSQRNEELKKWVEHFERVTQSASQYYNDIELLHVVLDALDIISLKSMD